MFTTILLAAGLSSRFGSPKALAQVEGLTLLERLQTTFLSAGVDEVIIVLGHDPTPLKPSILKHTKIKVVYNKDYKMGQTLSFQCGLRYSSTESKGYFLQPVDYPLLKILEIQQLMATFSDRKRIFVPTYQGRKGHPPLFHAALRKELLTLSPDLGLNTVLANHREETKMVPCFDPGVVLTFNTPKELRDILFEAGLKTV